MQHIQQLKTRPTFADLLNAIETDDSFSARRKTELRRDIEAFCGWLDRLIEPTVQTLRTEFVDYLVSRPRHARI
jgi:hypothetical protein